MYRHIYRTLLWLLPCTVIVLIFSLRATPQINAAPSPLQWVHLSTTTGDLPQPGGATEQTAALILDIDGDTVNDFVIASRRAKSAIVWFRRRANSWERYVIESAAMDIEAGGAYHDIDGDGDLDIVMGGDAKSNQVWWWENPAPNFDPAKSWSRHLIKSSGATKHHDQIFGDFDGDGRIELVFWNQNAMALFLAEIPANPRTATTWPLTQIYSWSGGAEHEGLAQADIDGDGLSDIIGGGRWFKAAGNGLYTAQVIDDSQRFSRAAAGQLVAGGAPEVVFGCGDCTGPLQWYELRNNRWIAHALLDTNIKKGHSLAMADFDGDGALDIFAAEMRLNENNAKANMWVFLGDNSGNFTPTVVASGYGNHESKVGDLNGDGTPDILGKPYNWQTPRLDIWFNQRTCGALDQWQRHVVDQQRPWRALFVRSGDLDGDRDPDIATGGWWYKNPGTAGGTWARNTIGAPLNNVAALYDFDGDGDLDVLGTQGKGSNSNAQFAWARNDGKGNFTVLTNIANGDGDFLQGVAVARLQGNQLGVALSWHVANVGLQLLTVPAAPSTTTWSWQRISATSQDEELSAGDIDGDNDLDLLLGTIWLRNNGSSGWQPVPLHNTKAAPDRNRLADINGDGRLDAVVGYEAVSKPGLVAWYEQPASSTSAWIEHPIATVTGPMSLDVVDMDRDGDLDVIVGEHNLADPAAATLYLFENIDGRGTQWQSHVIYVGDEHHDGAQVVDIDVDGDPDIVSIGWGNDRVLLYENRGSPCSNGPRPTPTPTVAPGATATPTPASTPTPTGTSCDVTGSLVGNPGFEQGTKLWKLAGKPTTFTTVDGALGCGAAAAITLATPLKAQLLQADIALEPNTRYQLSFDGYSSNGNDMAIYVHKHRTPFTNYGLKIKQVDLTGNWQKFQYEFITKGFTTPVADARLRLWLLGETNNVVYGIDNVLLVKSDGVQSANAVTVGIAEAVALEVDEGNVVELYRRDGELLGSVLRTSDEAPTQIIGADDQVMPSPEEVIAVLQQLDNAVTDANSDPAMLAMAIDTNSDGSSFNMTVFLPIVQKQPAMVFSASVRQSTVSSY